MPHAAITSPYRRFRSRHKANFAKDGACHGLNETAETHVPVWGVDVLTYPNMVSYSRVRAHWYHLTPSLVEGRFGHRLHLAIFLKNILERRRFYPHIRVATDTLSCERHDVVAHTA